MKANYRTMDTCFSIYNRADSKCYLIIDFLTKTLGYVVVPFVRPPNKFSQSLQNFYLLGVVGPLRMPKKMSSWQRRSRAAVKIKYWDYAKESCEMTKPKARRADRVNDLFRVLVSSRCLQLSTRKKNQKQHEVEKQNELDFRAIGSLIYRSMASEANYQKATRETLIFHYRIFRPMLSWKRSSSAGTWKELD